MASQDIEAGRAYVTLYLERMGFDQQVDQAQADVNQMESQAAPAEQHDRTLFDSAKHAAAGKAGSMAMEKLVRTLFQTRAAAAAAAPALAGVGAAASGAATATTAVATAAPVAATGLMGLATAAAPLLVPLAAIAAVAAVVYAAIFKWRDLSPPVKALLIVVAPVVLVIRALVLAFRALNLVLLPVRLALRAVGLAVSTLFLPFRLVFGAVGLLRSALLALPRALLALPGLFLRLGTAAWNMTRRLISGVTQMATVVVRSAARITAALARLPGQLASYAAAGVNAIAQQIRSLGTLIGRVGAVATGLSAAIVTPLTLAARQFASFGDKIRQVQNEYLQFALTAEEASLLSRVADQTGESMDRLVKQLRDGTRDFSRWRAEVAAAGTLMSGPQQSAALALSRAYYSLQESLLGLQNAIGAALADSLIEGTAAITGAIRGVISWVNNNRPLIAQLFRVAWTVAAVGTAVTTLGGAIAAAGTVLTPFTAALAAIAAGLAVVEYRTSAGRNLWATYGDTVRRVYATVVNYLSQMAAFTQRVLGGIYDALIGGDLATAVNVLWSGARVAWIAALVELDTLTRGMFGGLLQNLAAGRWQAAAEALMNALRIVWQEGILKIASLWNQVVDAADTAWTGLQTSFATVMGSLEKTWIQMFESLKGWGIDFLNWMLTNVLIPLGESISKYSTAAAKPIRNAAQAIRVQRNALQRAQRTPEQLEQDLANVDNQNATDAKARENELLVRQADRLSAYDRLRLDREAQIAELRRRQAQLEDQGAMAAAQQLAEQESALQTALDAAKAAREAAEANRLQDGDFAVSTATRSIAQFSGQALELMIGRGANDPQKQIAKLGQDQLTELRKIARELNLTLQEVLRLQAQGGFA